MGAAIAQWICLRLPSSRPGFDSQALHLCFYHLWWNLYFICPCVVKKNENKPKRSRVWPIFLKKKLTRILVTSSTGLMTVERMKRKFLTEVSTIWKRLSSSFFLDWKNWMKNKLVSFSLRFCSIRSIFSFNFIILMVMGIQPCATPLKVTFKSQGREPRSSGYGRRIVFRRLWVQILAPYTGWT